MRETNRAEQAWLDYLAMGPGRSLPKLALHYQVIRNRGGEATVPTINQRTLETWSSEHGWQERLSSIASQEQDQLTDARREVLEEGLGLAHERAKRLKALAEIVYSELVTYDKRWLKDYKILGSGESAQVFTIERFNASGFEQFRGLLDDIAKEKGERVKITAKQQDDDESNAPDALILDE